MDVMCLSLILSTFSIFEKESLRKPETHRLARLANQQLQDSARLSGIRGTCHGAQLFYIDSGDPNPGPHVCAGGTLLTETSLAHSLISISAAYPLWNMYFWLIFSTYVS